MVHADLNSTVRRVFQPENSFTVSLYGSIPAKRHDLRLLLGVLGCPLAPIPLVNDPIHRIHIKNTPIENSAAHYIIQQYLASTGCLKQQKSIKNMYSTGSVKMVRCETEISSGKNVKSLGTRSGENGCFVLWQMLPGMWSLELVVGENKVIAGSDGKTVWRHTPWLGTHAAKGPQRPLRRIIQGLDPKNTANLFGKAQCLGEKRIGENDCFVLKVAADREAVIERSEGPAEVLRHVLYGYFCQKSGLLIYLEDSHLTRVQTPENETIYWETTIGSSIGDYRDVDGVLIAHQGRSIATVFRFEELSVQHSRTRMEEVWRIDDVVFNVQGLSMDSFIPPADIFDASP
ncbi:LIPASE [Salix koriyanagi]|uniref:LIPASE n=1 Tax=Salix koriyanagi TaxID=2511006 RepID=A0A9Q0WJP1_9ROSI|nr:LIPASE [Salix koriyanagi]